MRPERGERGGAPAYGTLMRKVVLISIAGLLLIGAGVVVFRYPHAVALLADQRYSQAVLCLFIALATAAMAAYSISRKGQ